jgi:hypothetical protein
MATAFSGYAKESIAQDGDSPNVILDKSLFSIRKGLEREHPDQELDFYRPPIREMWMKSDAEEDKDEDGESADDKKKHSESDTGPRIWIEKTLVKGRPDREQGEHRLGAALWSPQKAKNGADIYKEMRAVREGDVVLHLIDNSQFSGVSVAAGGADSAFQGLPNTAWQGPAFRVPLRDYLPLDPPLERPRGQQQRRKQGCKWIAPSRYGQPLFGISNIDGLPEFNT